jgi:hypothetical protein
MITLTNQAKNRATPAYGEPFFGWLFLFTRPFPASGATLTNAAKHSASLSNQAKHSTSITNQAKH